MIPIIIPSVSSSGVEYIFPKWIEVIIYFGSITTAIGIVWSIVAVILSIVTDDIIDPTEKPHIYSLALTLLGLAVLLIGIVLALLTGQEITE